MLEFPAAITLNRRHAGNAPGLTPSPWMAPAALLRRHTIMVAFSALPLLVFGAAAVSRPAPAPAVPVKIVQTEGVRVIRMDSQTFRVRWSPVSDMPPVIAHREPETFREVPVRVLTRTPPATEVRYARTSTENASSLFGGESALAGTVTGAAHPTALPPRHRMRSRSASLDICARHGQRKVMVGRYKWRCRR